MLRLILVAAVAAALIGTAFAPSASAATLCVGAGAGCFAQIQPAVAAAHDGDTIAVAPGTFAGGITIDKSIRVQGAGANRTIIRGGGPVVTIFRTTAPDALNVSIDSVTITGGVNSTQPGTAAASGSRPRSSTSRRSTAPAPPSRSRTASSRATP